MHKYQFQNIFHPLQNKPCINEPVQYLSSVHKALGSMPSTIKNKQTKQEARCQWLTPVILSIWETKIRRVKVRSQSRQIVLETLP
jgi:hypothetical protein